jgi:hypothetical protein
VRNQLVQPPTPQTGFTSPANGQLTISALNFLTKIINALNGAITPAGVAQVTLGNGMTISSANGTPNGMVTGNVGDLYTNTAGGATTTLWVKTSNSGANTGWTAK